MSRMTPASQPSDGTMLTVSWIHVHRWHDGTFEFVPTLRILISPVRRAKGLRAASRSVMRQGTPGYNDEATHQVRRVGELLNRVQPRVHLHRTMANMVGSLRSNLPGIALGLESVLLDFLNLSLGG